jgi:hypothetical protein
MVIEAYIVVRELPHGVLARFPSSLMAADLRFHTHDVIAEQIWFHGESPVDYSATSRNTGKDIKNFGKECVGKRCREE